MCPTRMNHAIPWLWNLQTVPGKHWSRECVLFLSFILIESVKEQATAEKMSRKHGA